MPKRKHNKQQRDNQQRRPGERWDTSSTNEQQPTNPQDRPRRPSQRDEKFNQKGGQS